MNSVLLAVLAGASAPSAPSALGPFFDSDNILSTDWDRAYNNSAIYDPVADKTYVAWQTADARGFGFKSVRLTAYDHSLGTWSAPVSVGNFAIANDAHGVPTLEIDADGYIYCFFGTHDNDQKWSVSNSPNDASKWTQLEDLPGNYTYAHANAVGSNMYLLARDSTVTTNQVIVLRTGPASGGNITFFPQFDLIDLGADTRAYMGESHVVGTEIHIIMTKANAADTVRRGVYYFIYDTVAGSVKNFSGSTVIGSGSFPVSLAQADANFRLFDHGGSTGGIPSLNFDSLGNPHIIFTDGSNPTYSLKHFYHDGVAWTSPVTIATIADITVGGYDSTYTIVPSGASMWAVYVSGTDIARRVFTGGSWATETTVIPSEGKSLLYNSFVKNAHSDIRFIASEYAPWSFDEDADAKKLYVYGDSGGALGAVALTPNNPNWDDTALLLGFESRGNAVSCIDESAAGVPFSSFNGNAKIDSAQSKFGGKSLYFSATNDYVTFPSSDLWSLVTGDFTAECWIRLQSVGVAQAIMSTRPLNGQHSWQLQTSASNEIQLVYWSSSSTPVLVLTTSGTLTVNTWHHVAFCRQGATSRVFIDGALSASGVQSSAPSYINTPLTIGRDSGSLTRYLNGWIDELEISRYAKYTAAFTPSASPSPRGF